MLERKEKIETIIILDQEETRTNPSQTNLSGETKAKVTKTPKGEITTNTKGRTTTIFENNIPCALCSEYGHYTHHCPQTVDFK
jgi:hypothetical protein